MISKHHLFKLCNNPLRQVLRNLGEGGCFVFCFVYLFVLFSDKERVLWLGDLPGMTRQWQHWNGDPELADVHLEVPSQEASTDLPNTKTT